MRPQCYPFKVAETIDVWEKDWDALGTRKTTSDYNLIAKKEAHLLLSRKKVSAKIKVLIVF